MANTKSTSTRSRSETARGAPRRPASSGAASKTPGQSLAEEARTAVRSVRTRATRAAKKVPTDTTSLSIAAGVIAGIVAVGVAIFMNRDRLRSVASTSGARLRRAADDLSTMAHDRIDQARGNITRLRGRDGAGSGAGQTPDGAETMSMAN